MRTSLVTRLTVMIAVIIATAFVAIVIIVNQTTSQTFVDTQVEVREVESRPQIEQKKKLARKLESIFERGGWQAVQNHFQSTLSQLIGDKAEALIVDQRQSIVATTRPIYQQFNIRRNKNNFWIRGDTLDGVTEITLSMKHVIPLQAAGQEIGYVMLLPSIGERNVREQLSGQGFAGLVWKSAAVWLVLVTLIAMVATSLLLRRSLRPLNLLTNAANELQQGKIPDKLNENQDREFSKLIGAFNSAAASIAQTETMRKQLISDIAHELRTPLTNIKGQLEAAKLGLAAPDREMIDLLRSETQLLERLVEDFQQLALSDAGQLKVNLRPMPICESLAGIVHSLINATDAKLSTQLQGDGWVLSDEDRLKQVFGNLIDNATQYAGQDCHIYVSTKIESDFVAIHFSDNGPGIEPQHRPFIFERFYRAEKSRSRRTGGSGLGLAIVKSLVEALQGTIEYLEKPGMGAAFVIRLPLTDGSLVESQ